MTERSDTYNSYSIDAEDQPQAGGDSNADDRGLPEPLDEGYSPPEKYSAGQRFGNTAAEESAGETLDQRLAQEVPDADVGSVGEQVGGEVGEQRAGRLVGDGDDVSAIDVGIDGAAAGAEEAAVHVIDETVIDGT